MYPLQKNNPFYNNILLLDAEEQKRPQEFIEYFNATYELKDVRCHLHNLVQLALTTRNVPFEEAKDRARLSRFAEDLETVMEAITLLQHKREVKQ